MTRLRYRTKIDLGVAAVTIVIGAFFTYQVSLVESIAEDAIGPRMIPYFLSIAMMVLGLIIGILPGLGPPIAIGRWRSALWSLYTGCWLPPMPRRANWNYARYSPSNPGPNI